ncbi:hypothetical protein LDENG_00271730 [Lucifuga dentata]|nr:hypothetical protein LDENG_00271730 [Lucifuga dentata]
MKKKRESEVVREGWQKLAGLAFRHTFLSQESFSFPHKLAVENEQTVLRVCYVHLVNCNTPSLLPPAVSSVRMSLTQNLQLTACTCETSGSVLVFS